MHKLERFARKLESAVADARSEIPEAHQRYCALVLNEAPECEILEALKELVSLYTRVLKFEPWALLLRERFLAEQALQALDALHPTSGEVNLALSAVKLLPLYGLETQEEGRVDTEDGDDLWANW